LSEQAIIVKNNFKESQLKNLILDTSLLSYIILATFLPIFAFRFKGDINVDGREAGSVSGIIKIHSYGVFLHSNRMESRDFIYPLSIFLLILSIIIIIGMVAGIIYVLAVKKTLANEFIVVKVILKLLNYFGRGSFVFFFLLIYVNVLRLLHLKYQPPSMTTQDLHGTFHYYNINTLLVQDTIMAYLGLILIASILSFNYKESVLEDYSSFTEKVENKQHAFIFTKLITDILWIVTLIVGIFLPLLVINYVDAESNEGNIRIFTHFSWKSSSNDTFDNFFIDYPIILNIILMLILIIAVSVFTIKLYYIIAVERNKQITRKLSLALLIAHFCVYIYRILLIIGLIVFINYFQQFGKFVSDSPLYNSISLSTTGTGTSVFLMLFSSVITLLILSLRRFLVQPSNNSN
jgi:hypothetical protein